jgi:hypothetical protein
MWAMGNKMSLESPSAPEHGTSLVRTRTQIPILSLSALLIKTSRP